MKIFFSKKQYETLVKLVYLGNWVANSTSVSGETDPECEEVEQYVFSFADDFGMGHLLEKAGDGKTDPTGEFEDLCDPYIDEYNEEIFWGKLIDRLALRDLVEKEGKETVEGMDIAERFGKEQPFIEKYEDEFEEWGIRRLRITASF